MPELLLPLRSTQPLDDVSTELRLASVDRLLLRHLHRAAAPPRRALVRPPPLPWMLGARAAGQPSACHRRPRTGSAACPLGRCEVRPCVPEVDQDLESKMRSRLGFKQLATHAATAELAPLDEESAAAAAVNAWAAAGCKLDQPDEIEAARREVVARTAAEAAAAAATNATMDDSHLAVAPRRCNFHAASILLSISLTLFFAFLCFNDGAKARDLSPCTTPANYNQPLPVTCATATHPHLCRYSAAAHPPSRALCIPHGTRRGITRSLHTRFSTPCVAQNYATWEKVWVWSLFASSACLGFILLLFDTKDMTRVLLSLRRRGSAVGGIFSSSRTAPVEAAEPV